MLWVLIVVLLGVFCLPFVWLVGDTLFTAFQSSGNVLILRLGTNSTLTDNVDTFFTNLNTYFLILALFGLMLFAFVYSQKKGELVYEGY